MVEDDPGIVRGLAVTLGQQGWAVDCVKTLAHAWTALRTEPFDVVLLDLGLPDGDGTSLLGRLRQSFRGQHPDPSLPVIVMTARDQVTDCIAVLDLGADDYLTKPFDPSELAARIRAVRRRTAGRSESNLRHGPLQLNLADHRVQWAGQPVELSAREFGVLLALVEVSPRVLSREQIESALYRWDQVIASNAIEVYVHRLRRKLSDGFIKTMRGVGYFVPDEDLLQ